VLTYLLFRLGGLLIPRLPLGLVYWLADRAGDFAYLFAGPARRNLQGNLHHVFGDADDPKRMESTCGQVFRNAARNMVDMLRLPLMTGERVERLVTVHGYQNVEVALARGKGVVLTSAHFGQMEVAAQIAGIRGLRPVVLHERLRPQRLYDYVAGLRSRMGIQFVPIGDASALKLAFRTLRHNGLLGVVADRDVTNSGRVVKFFGADARLPDGHVTLALHTGAAIVIAFCLRKPGNQIEAFVEPPMILEDTGDREGDVERGMARVISVLERYIGANPEQWVYFQPVWLDAAEKKE
jgi:KDO2-lipid IV(A) lauroyltransferase